MWRVGDGRDGQQVEAGLGVLTCDALNVFDVFFYVVGLDFLELILNNTSMSINTGFSKSL